MEMLLKALLERVASPLSTNHLREDLQVAHKTPSKWRVHFIEDTEGRELDLKFFRDVDLREVDFVITENSKPILMVEVKISESPLSLRLNYLRLKFPQCEAWQIHLRGDKDYRTPEGIRVAPARVFLEVDFRPTSSHSKADLERTEMEVHRFHQRFLKLDHESPK
jgi:predicted AAA+ superfamily ATPase